jgi:hypothetical protein
MKTQLFARIVGASLFAMALSAAAQTSLPSTNQSQQSYLPFKFSPDIAQKGFFNLDAEWYGSMGFDKTYYHNSDINVSQPGLGNNFTVNSVQGHDEYKTPGLRSPDNLRIGRFIDSDRIWGVELSLDHNKFTSTANQTANVTGVMGPNTNNNPNYLGLGSQQLTNQSFAYMLHNGLNSLMVSAVYRKPLIGQIADSSSLSFIAKIGTGLAIVHPYNEISGNENDVGQKNWTNVIGFNSGWWRIVGTSTGVEAGLRYEIKKPVYVEFTNKQIFTEMNNIPVYQGSSSQKLWSSQYVLSVGYEFGGLR